MTAAVDVLLRDLVNAVGARALYPAEHPRTREVIDRVERLLQQLTSVQGEVSIFAVDEKVVHEGSVLPGSEPLAKGLFRVLKTCGYDRLTIKRGVTHEEIDGFIAVLAEITKRPETAAPTLLKPTANIRLSAFQARPGSKLIPLTEADFLAQETHLLNDVWAGVLASRKLDMPAVQGIVIALSKTIEENLGAMIPMASLKSHDEYTATHIINVALLAMALAEAVELPDQVVYDLGIAALLHDVGKLQVPTGILNKPDRLTDSEFSVVKRHPEDGARILYSTPGVPELAVVVAFEHHMRYDGGGYPAVRRGWKMNFASAITQVADIYDALRTDRPYRLGLDRDTIATIMTGEAGKHFDPDLLAAFFTRVVPKAALG